MSPYPLRRSQGFDAKLLHYLELCGGASAHKGIDVSMEESQKALILGIISLHLDTSLILQEVLRNASILPDHLSALEHACRSDIAIRPNEGQ